jgi:hypothetical protein
MTCVRVALAGRLHGAAGADASHPAELVRGDFVG